MSNSDDLIHRFLFEQSDIRGEIVTLSQTFREAFSAQTIPEALRPLFGEFLVGAAMISEILKFDGLVTLQARGEGSLSLIMAESNSKGHLRGVLTKPPETSLVIHDEGKLKPLPELIGKGVLALTLDPNRGQRYQGIVPLEGVDLAACLSDYFEQSEQIPTFIILFANQEKCGGIFLQCLPSKDGAKLEERNTQWETLCSLTQTMNSEEFFSTDHATVLYRLFHEQECQIFEPKSLTFKCSCSRERSRNALASLGTEELNKLIEEEEPVEIDCQFCGSKYLFNKKHLQALIQAPNTLH